ncbi:MAG: succinate dehydrogenase, hydrophobic membrane anchor protein [Azospirillaceae bacterium]
MSDGTPTSLRTALGRVRGLGSAKSGTEHWWLQRLTSVALIPLTLWFAISVISLVGAPYEEVRAWLARPWSAVLMILMLVATFHHAAAGMQVIYEDYIHSHWLRLAVDLATKGLAFLLAAYGVVAVLKIAFGG